MKRFLLIAALMLAFPVTTLAHESEEGEPHHWSPPDPPLDNSPASAAMRYCLTEGARAAWGAQARFLGAPSTFKYIEETPLKKMFYGDPKEIPTDAIYVWEAMNIDERRQYEEVAFYGWKQADAWVKEGRERPEYEVLTAIFYDGCKKNLTSIPQEEKPLTPEQK